MPHSVTGASSTSLLTLSDLATNVDAFQPQQLQLYLIIRRIKPDLPKSTRAMNRYVFTPYRVDADASLQEFLIDRISDELEKVVRKECELTPFDVTPDADEEVVFQHPRSSDIGAFQPLLEILLNEGVDEQRLLREELGDVLPDVWAYCVRLQPDNPAEAPYLCFQRYQQSKIAQPDRRTIRTLFIRTTNNVELELLEGTTMTFDCRIDCVYHDENFYILNKKGFEDIAVLDEQYQVRANELIAGLEVSGYFEGLEHLTSASTLNSVLRRKLVRLFRLQEHERVSTDRIAKMIEVATKHGKILPISPEGKISLTCSADADLLIKLLDDYFLHSEQTGLDYGSSTKRRLST